MSRTRGTTSNLHRRLTVAWLDAGERASLTAALPNHVLVVGRGMLHDLATRAAERRRELEAGTDAALEDEVHAIDARRTSAERELQDLLSEQRRLREAAEWCELQPRAAADHGARIEALTAELDDHSRTAREATRRLERVLEQRAAAEAALEDARRELDGLGATGIDETDVRRQMEAASHELRATTTEYQEAMKDLARSRATVGELEEQSARNESVAVPEAAEVDQFQAMGRALRAKFETSTACTETLDHTDLARARADLDRAQERADEAAQRLSTVRRRIDGFETELTARTDDGEARDSRHDAAVALEAQVSSVERQLAEAEAEARSDVEEATRSVSRAELALERLRQEEPNRRRKLTELARLVPDLELAGDGDELLDHAGPIARALRELAEPMQADVDRAATTVESASAEHDEKLSALNRRRAGRMALLPEDRRAALRTLIGDETGVVLLDDVVGLEDAELLDVEDLEAVEAAGPMVVLTGDGDVAAWAIELPYEQGRLGSPSELWSLTAPDPAIPPTTTDRPPARSTSW